MTDKFADAIESAKASGPAQPTGDVSGEQVDLSGLPLDFFDDAASNAVADEGFMPGTALPVQQAHVILRDGKAEASRDGTNICLVHRVEIIKGEKSKGSFFNRIYLLGKSKEKQQNMTNRLTGFASSVGLKLPPKSALAAAKKNDLAPITQYAASFDNRELVTGVGLKKNEAGEVTGNQMTGYFKKTPEQLAKLNTRIEAAKRRKGITTSPSPIA